ncbi:TPA: hypothetical protein ACGQLW_004585, partial [Escherichia coli]
AWIYIQYQFIKEKMACQDLMIVIIINMMKGELYRSESLLTLWQHHSLSILRRNTKTGHTP